MNVTCVPRGTVMFCGQTALFAIVIVVDVGPAVQVPPVDGPVLGLEPPQAAKSAAMAPASTALAASWVVWVMS